jgi:hypothetical protein
MDDDDGISLIGANISDVGFHEIIKINRPDKRPVIVPALYWSPVRWSFRRRTFRHRTSSHRTLRRKIFILPEPSNTFKCKLTIRVLTLTVRVLRSGAQF